MPGNDVVSQGGKEIQSLDADGQVWAAESSKRTAGVAAHRETLVCAAGY
ncbi:MAG TPA: hypothetical protein VIY49_11645 [Bryobacteraceae bacterium]